LSFLIWIGQIISVTHQPALFNDNTNETIMPFSADSDLEKDFSASSSRAVKHSRRKGILYSFIVLLLFGLFAFQLWFHILRTSVTIDEPVHILY